MGCLLDKLSIWIKWLGDWGRRGPPSGKKQEWGLKLAHRWYKDFKTRGEQEDEKAG